MEPRPNRHDYGEFEPYLQALVDWHLDHQRGPQSSQEPLTDEPPRRQYTTADLAEILRSLGVGPREDERITTMDFTGRYLTVGFARVLQLELLTEGDDW